MSIIIRSQFVLKGLKKRIINVNSPWRGKLTEALARISIGSSIQNEIEGLFFVEQRKTFINGNRKANIYDMAINNFAFEHITALLAKQKEPILQSIPRNRKNQMLPKQYHVTFPNLLIKLVKSIAI